MKIRLKYILSALFIIPIALIGMDFFSHPSQADSIVPEPKIMELNGEPESLSIAEGFEEGFVGNYTAFFEWLDEDFSQLDGPENSIEIHLMPSPVIPDSLEKYLENEAAYYINRDNRQISIVAADTAGVLNALTTLKKLIRQNNGELADGYIIDWPDHSIRAFHFVARNVLEEEALEMLEKTRLYNFNTIIVQLADGVRLNSMEGLYRPNAWERSFLEGYVQRAKEFGLDFIPELKFLSHQNKLFKKRHPELMYNRTTYDPRLPETQAKVKEIIDEVIELTEPGAIHIGHDEVHGITLPYSARNSGKIPGEEDALPAGLFKESVVLLHEYLSSKGVETWMWGDMLLRREEIPEMFKWTLNANEQYAGLIDEIPNDIVICDWHYWDNQPEFPSVDLFIKNGFRVVGATWKKERNIRNFSNYMHQFDENGSGMIATTWFHVQRDEWEIVDDVLKMSSESFWNAE